MTLVFEATPFTYDQKTGEFTKEAYQRLLEQAIDISILPELVIKPFDETAKKAADKAHRKGKENAEWDFGKDSEVKKVECEVTTTGSSSWQKIYDDTRRYLSHKAVESRVREHEGLKKIEGRGYCILASDLIEEITRLKEEVHTSNSTSAKAPKLTPPTRYGAKEEPITTIEVPTDLDYGTITPETAQIYRDVKRFLSSVSKHLTKPYEMALERQMELETGFSKKNVPGKDKVPIRTLRLLGDSVADGIVHTTMTTSQSTAYSEIMGTVIDELVDVSSPDEGEVRITYRASGEGEETMVTITSVLKRLGELYLEHLSTNIRYTHTPKF